jgi:hypothetical protein
LEALNKATKGTVRAIDTLAEMYLPKTRLERYIQTKLFGAKAPEVDNPGQEWANFPAHRDTKDNMVMVTIKFNLMLCTVWQARKFTRTMTDLLH